MPKATYKDKALAALIATGTVRAAAAECGLGEATLYRYLKDSEFKAEIRDARRQLFEQTITQLQVVSGAAVAALKESLASGNSSVVIRAASIILANSFKGFEISDILERLEVLENEHKDKN